MAADGPSKNFNMNWLNLNIQTLDSENFLGSEPTDRATWLCLLRYCIGQENGGIIEDSREWGDRKWQQLVRVTKKEALRECELWEWEGEALIVWGYPGDKEAEIKHLRAIGKQTSEAKKNAAKANGAKGGRPTRNPTENPTETQQETQTEPIERKGKEIEVEERESAGAKKSSARPLGGDPKSIADTYPRREKTAEALAIIAKHLGEGEDYESMLAGTRACAAVIRTLPSGPLNRYVPSAESFFLHKRWKDDPETLRRQGNQSTGQGQMNLEEAAKLLGRRALQPTD